MMKKVLAALLAVCMLASLMFIPASAAGFDDVADDHWAKESIDRWAGYGVLNGKAEGKFDPAVGMKRSEFAKFIVTLLGLPVDEDAEVPFDDVMGTNDEWAAPYITAANKAGIINGVGGKRFSPSRDVKFNEGATMMSRALGLVTLEESSGDGFKTAAVDKLTELGMLDENVKADMTFDRAGVAGLADNMIEFYANDAEADAVVVGGAEEATEVKGVILAVNGGKINVENATVKAPIVVTSEASVEVKSSTVEAPIVVDSASVALTETKAADVAVSGEKASVTADKDSTVAEVAVSGTAPSVELNGTVEKVTVAEGTTEVEVKGEGVSAENVTNNTTEEIKVNDEPVAPTPAEPENPDDNQGGSTGFVPEPTKPVEQPTVDTGAAATKDDQKTTTKDDAGTVTVPADKTACDGNNHTWGAKNAEKSQAATCTADGFDVYVCTNSDCAAEKKVSVPKLGHKWYKSAVTPATCTTKGVITWSCANGDVTCEKIAADAEAGIEKNKEKFPELGHTQVSFAAKDPTCVKYGWTAGIQCGRSGCSMNHSSLEAGTTAPDFGANNTWFVKPSARNPLGHDIVKLANGKYGCSRADDCGYEEKDDCPINHATILKTATCSVCKEKGTHDPAGESHTAGATFSKDATKHWKVCTVPGCGAKVGETTHTYGPGDPVVSGTTYCECGATKACTKDHSQILTNATCSDCGGAGTKTEGGSTPPATEHKVAYENATKDSKVAHKIKCSCGKADCTDLKGATIGEIVICTDSGGGKCVCGQTPGDAQ